MPLLVDYCSLNMGEPPPCIEDMSQQYVDIIGKRWLITVSL